MADEEISEEEETTEEAGEAVEPEEGSEEEGTEEVPEEPWTAEEWGLAVIYFFFSPLLLWHAWKGKRVAVSCLTWVVMVCIILLIAVLFIYFLDITLTSGALPD